MFKIICDFDFLKKTGESKCYSSNNTFQYFESIKKITMKLYCRRTCDLTKFKVAPLIFHKTENDLS